MILREYFKLQLGIVLYKTCMCNCTLFVQTSCVLLEFWVSILLCSLSPSFLFTTPFYQIITVTKSSTLKFENGGKFALYANLISPCGFTISDKMFHLPPLCMWKLVFLKAHNLIIERWILISNPCFRPYRFHLHGLQNFPVKAQAAV